MNEIKDFLTQSDAILKRLNLPSLLLSESDEEDSHELLSQRIVLCFPNLNVEECRCIRRLHILAKAVCCIQSLDKLSNGEADPAKVAAAKAFIDAEYADLVAEVDKSGIRARLSDFQEKLLDYFLQSRPTAAQV